QLFLLVWTVSRKTSRVPGSSEDLLKPLKDELMSTLEGTSVTLSYKYPKLSTGDYFYWYQQFPGKPLEFMISHSSSGTKGNEKVKGLKIQVENKQIDLQISSAAVTDSAVYYCAVQPTVTGNNKTLILIHHKPSLTLSLTLNI
uniref:Immunoglobulin V-set domain-containing protein n=1 Tax=Oryzias latipes TaxID=8090 RepID=A0A3P9JCA3_ORYLA